MTCPSVTGELKSTDNFWMMPEIWLPTSTLTRGFNWPLAVTTCVSSPRVTRVVSYCNGLPEGRFKYQPRPAPLASRATINDRFSRRNCAGLFIPNRYCFPSPYALVCSHRTREQCPICCGCGTGHIGFSPQFSRGSHPTAANDTHADQEARSTRILSRNENETDNVLAVAAT